MYLGWLLWELNDILLGEFSLFFHSYLYYYWFLKFMLNDGCKRDQKIKTNLLSWRSRGKRTLWSWDGQLQANAFYLCKYRAWESQVWNWSCLLMEGGTAELPDGFFKNMELPTSTLSLILTYWSRRWGT